jgi:hypothetical protein
MGKSESMVWKVGLANKFLESTRLKRDKSTIDANRVLAEKLAKNVSELSVPESVGGGYLFKDVPYEYAEDFFSSFKSSNIPIRTDPLLIVGYLREGKDFELSKWDIYFPGVEEDPKRDLLVERLTEDLVIRCQKRSVDESDSASTTTEELLVHNRLRVASRPVEDIGLSNKEKDQAEKDFDDTERKSEKTQYPDRIYRRARKKPLLIVHLIDYTVENTPGCEQGVPVVAWSLSLPGTDRKETSVKYQINAVLANQQLSFADLDIADDEMDKDEVYDA